jgi:hypothetical protein
MPSPVYQYGQSDSGVSHLEMAIYIFMDFVMWEDVLLTFRFVDVAEFATPLSFLVLCKLSFPIVVLKMSSVILWH